MSRSKSIAKKLPGLPSNLMKYYNWLFFCLNVISIIYIIVNNGNCLEVNAEKGSACYQTLDFLSKGAGVLLFVGLLLSGYDYLMLKSKSAWKSIIFLIINASLTIFAFLIARFIVDLFNIF